MIHIDDSRPGSIENSDWTKVVGWDLGVAEDWERMPLEQVRRFVELPAFTQAPDDVREVAERRLAEGTSP